MGASLDVDRQVAYSLIRTTLASGLSKDLIPRGFVHSHPGSNHPIAGQEQVSHTDLQACLWRYEAKRKSSPSVDKRTDRVQL